VGRINTLYSTVNKIVILSRNLNQSMHKKRYFLDKFVKIPLALGALPSLQTPWFLQRPDPVE